MSQRDSNIVPEISFRYRADAERAERALRASGIDCSIKEPEEAPHGSRMAPSELRFTIWVPRERCEEASRIIQECGGASRSTDLQPVRRSLSDCAHHELAKWEVAHDPSLRELPL